jgi:hypothetical protein
MWIPPWGLSEMNALCEVNYIIVNDVHIVGEVGELGKLWKIGIDCV